MSRRMAAANSPTLKAMGANREGDFSRWFESDHRPRRHRPTVEQSNAAQFELSCPLPKLPSSMTRQSQQGQALRVLASSQSCSLSLSMLHPWVAKAKRLQSPTGLRAKGLVFFLFFSRESVLKTKLTTLWRSHPHRL
jgi:hypothetical protein